MQQKLPDSQLWIIQKLILSSGFSESPCLFHLERRPPDIQKVGENSLGEERIQAATLQLQGSGYESSQDWYSWWLKSGIHQLRLVVFSHYLGDFIHPGWLFGISSISITEFSDKSLWWNPPATSGTFWGYASPKVSLAGSWVECISWN